MKARALRVALFGLAALLLLGSFLLYTRPEFLVTLAEQLWSCF